MTAETNPEQASPVVLEEVENGQWIKFDPDTLADGIYWLAYAYPDGDDESGWYDEPSTAVEIASIHFYEMPEDGSAPWDVNLLEGGYFGDDYVPIAVQPVNRPWYPRPEEVIELPKPVVEQSGEREL